MIGKKNDRPLYITAQEIAEITDRAGTIDSIMIADEIQAAVLKLQEGKITDRRWLYSLIISAIYDGGRIQGIREERAKAKEKARRQQA
jgi:hypothetical protein